MRSALWSETQTGFLPGRAHARRHRSLPLRTALLIVPAAALCLLIMRAGGGTLPIVVLGLGLAGGMTVSRSRTVPHPDRSAVSVREASTPPDSVVRAVVDRHPDLSLVIDAGGRIGYASPAATRLLGRPSRWLAGQDLAGIVHPDDRAQLLELRRVPPAQDGKWASYAHAELRLSSLDGQWVAFEVSVASLTKEPEVGDVLLTLRDMSKRKAFEEELRHQALHDPLTKLANRALFREHLQHALARYRHTDARPHAVLLVDLDGFKAINDSLGHSAGDEVLAEFAGRLRAMVRPGDTASRLGGDEFAVLLENSSLAEAAAFARHLLSSVRGPVVLDGAVALHGQEVVLTGSVGIAMTEPGQDAGELLRNADVAMYAAKAAGRDRYEVFRPEMQVAALKSLDLQTALRGAIEKDELVVHYQPIVDLGTGEVTGVEALVRWEDPERGLVPPGEFIPVAERSGLIKPIGAWVLERACRQVREWQEALPGRRSLHVSVNASAVQVEDPGFVEEVVTSLQRSGLAPSDLILEITESLFMEDFAVIVDKLEHLKGIGVRFAMDDFGTGFSSLSYLRSLPIDLLKIDKAFIDGVTGSPDQSALVRAVIQLAHTFDLETVAEGVERGDQCRALQMMGSDFGQGYLFARPLPAENLESLLVEGDRLLPVTAHEAHGPSSLLRALPS